MKDVNIASYYGTGIHLEGVMGEPSSRPGWSDTVKVTSGTWALNVCAARIYGGSEDCVDVNNRSRTVSVYAEFVPQGRYVATIKGGASNITLGGRIVGHPTNCDVEIGNWSDQSQEITGPVHLELWRNNGPVTVRVLHGMKPTHPENLEVNYLFPHPDAWYHRPVVAALFAWFRVSKAVARIFR